MCLTCIGVENIKQITNKTIITTVSISIPSMTVDTTKAAIKAMAMTNLTMKESKKYGHNNIYRASYKQHYHNGGGYIKKSNDFYKDYDKVSGYFHIWAYILTTYRVLGMMKGTLIAIMVILVMVGVEKAIITKIGSSTTISHTTGN